MWPVVSSFWRLMAVARWSEGRSQAAVNGSSLHGRLCQTPNQKNHKEGFGAESTLLVNMHFTTVTGGTVVSQGCQEVADWYLVCGLASYSCRESLFKGSRFWFHGCSPNRQCRNLMEPGTRRFAWLYLPTCGCLSCFLWQNTFPA